MKGGTISAHATGMLLCYTWWYVHTDILSSLMKDASSVVKGFTKAAKTAVILCLKDKLILYVVIIYVFECFMLNSLSKQEKLHMLKDKGNKAGAKNAWQQLEKAELGTFVEEKAARGVREVSTYGMRQKKLYIPLCFHGVKKHWLDRLFTILSPSFHQPFTSA